MSLLRTNDGVGEAHRGRVREADAGPLVRTVGHDGEVHLVCVLVVFPAGHVVAVLGIRAAAPGILPLPTTVVQAWENRCCHILLARYGN